MIRAVVAALLLFASSAAAGPYEDGARLYLEGVLPDGAPVTAQVMGGARLSGRFAACARCHRRSGYGISEGDIRAPDITAAALFAPLEPRRDRLLRELYQERQGPIARLDAKTPHLRPAYTGVADVERALSLGEVPGGGLLAAFMPRYDLGPEALAALHLYLRQLGTGSDPGVEDSEIHFATVIGPDIPAARERAMLDLMQAFIALRNREVARELARPGFSPNYKALFAPSRRLWRLHVWRLEGPPERWPAQLAAHYRLRPVFAMLGGAAAGDWTPVHAFCEATRLPCIFPQTDWPSTEPGYFTLYLSAGLPGEARLVADALSASSVQQVTQFHDATAESRHLTAMFARLAEAQGLRVETHDVPAAAQRVEADAAVLWLGPEAMRRALALPGLAEFAGPILAAGGLLADEGGRVAAPPRDLRVAWRYAAGGAVPPHIFRLRHWLRARRVAAADWERTQLNTYLALDATGHALTHMVDRFSRELFIEVIEHQVENGLNPGVFPGLSLGPDQRFAATGANMRVLTAGD